MSGYNLPIVENLFSLSSIITILIQFVVTFILFRKIRDEDGISATIGWAIGGFILIIFLIPFIIQKII